MRRSREAAGPLYAVGLALAVLTVVLATANATAMPVVLDVPLVTLLAAMATVLVLAGWFALAAGAPARAAGARRLLGAAGLLLALALAGWSARERLLSYRSAEARFSSGASELAGTLYVPRAAGRHPAVVLVHGSGPEARDEYRFFAKRFAAVGIAALAYDKRGVGESTGALWEADYQDYAEDVRAAVAFLGSRPEIDAGCLGLVGFSEAEWVAPLAAAGSAQIAFLAIVAPSGATPAEQVEEEIVLRLEARGFPPTAVEQAVALNRQVFAFQRSGQAPEGLAAELRRASAEPWFLAAEDIPAQLYPAEEYRWWRAVMDFAPGPVWAKVQQPVLLLKGGRDPNSAAEGARTRITAALASGGNRAVRFVVFPDGDHALLRWPLGDGVPPPFFVDGYPESLIEWVRERPCARRPPGAG